MFSGEVKGSPYDAMHKELNKIVGDYQIDLGKCDAFEELLLLSAGVKEKPKFCRFGDYAELEIASDKYCFFFLDISQEGLKQLLTINEQTPELQATDVTDLLSKKEGVKFMVEGHPVVAIRMSADGLREKFLPEFNHYLATHIETVWYYQRIGQNQSFPFDALSSTLNKLFMEEGMDTHKCDCFEETLCLVVQESFARAEQINLALLGLLPHALIHLIKNYLNVENYNNVDEIKALTTTKSRFQDSSNSEFHTTFFLTTPTKSARLIERFFNRMSSDSAILDDKLHEVKKLASGMTKLTVANHALNYPGFMSDVKDKLKHYSILTRDRYRKESATIKLTTEECLTKLEECGKQLTDEKEIGGLIKCLINTVRENGEENKDFQDGIQNLIQKFNELINKHKAGSASVVKHYLSTLNSSTVETAGQALEELTKIANKRFTPAPDG